MLPWQTLLLFSNGKANGIMKDDIVAIEFLFLSILFLLVVKNSCQQHKRAEIEIEGYDDDE